MNLIPSWYLAMDLVPSRISLCFSSPIKRGELKIIEELIFIGAETEVVGAMLGKKRERGAAAYPLVLCLQLSALIDHVTRVDSTLLYRISWQDWQLSADGCSLFSVVTVRKVNTEELNDILRELNAHILPLANTLSPIRSMAGGSVANTIRGLAAGFKVSIGIIGACGDDDQGRIFMHNMSLSGIDLSRVRIRKGPTAQCACLVDASGNWTMRPCLSNAVKLQANDFRREDFKGAKWPAGS